MQRQRFWGALSLVLWYGTVASEAVLAQPTDEVAGGLTDEWRIPAEIRYARMAALADGNIFFVGRPSDGDRLLARVFSPATGIWTEAAPPQTQSPSARLAALTDGRVLLIGAEGDSELFDPAQPSWASLGLLPPSRVTPEGFLHDRDPRGSLTSLGNGQILVLSSSCDNGTRLCDFGAVFDPETLSWSQVPQNELSDHTATPLSNGSVLVVGSRGTSSYEPTSGTWTEESGLTLRIKAHAATLLPNGQVLLTGGWDEDDDEPWFADGSSAALIYQPTTGNLSEAAPMHTGRALHETALLSDGRVIVLGGWTHNSGETTSTTEIYDPGANTWQPGPDLPDDDAQVLVVDDRLFVASDRSLLRFDTQTYTWVTSSF